MKEKNWQPCVIALCKDCMGTLAFPKTLSILQAKLHKRKNPSHTVIMSMNIGE